MADYTQITDFSAKDALTSSDPEKVILGSDVDAELEALATAIASKLDVSGLLTALLAVDGAGSGVDADSVDGVGPFAVGTYEATLTGDTNVDDATFNQGLYVRLGSIVLVAVDMDVDPTAAATTNVGISLPVASDIGDASDLIGVVVMSGGFVGRVVGSSSNNRAQAIWVTGSGTSGGVSCIFAYRVL